MRVKGIKEDLDYNKTKSFFNHRSSKYSKENPYNVTMYNDNDSELVKKRNAAEVEKLSKMMNFNEKSKVLDVACGVGRWADVVPKEVELYYGIDFSEELINIAKERHCEENFRFSVGSANKISTISDIKGMKFNKFLFIGILMYINDNDLKEMLKYIGNIAEEHATICIREAVGIKDRLTLKDFYSEELNEDYHAIYRTIDEYREIFKDGGVIQNGFKIKGDGYLFENPSLNNRTETIQYYFIFER